MKKLFLVFLLFLGYQELFSQTYGNEWINYSQQYYKISVATDGVCRINYATLQDVLGQSISIDPRRFQIFARGQEQYIYVKGEADGQFNETDYIEFYAQKNDGWLDSLLYVNRTDQANDRYSLFTDTATYYLTWNSSANNRRMIEENATDFSNYSPLNYFFKESRQDYTSTYYSGATDPQYTSGEGWFDAPFGISSTLPSSISKTISTSNVFTSGPNAQAKIILVGGSQLTHNISIEFNNTHVDTVFSGYSVVRVLKNVSSTQLGTNTTFHFTCNGVTANRTAIAYISIKYPHSLNLENLSQYSMLIPDQAGQGKALLNISNFYVSSSATSYLFDLTNHRRIKVVKSGSIYQTLVPNSGGEKQCFLTSDDQMIFPALKPVNNNGYFNDFSAATYIGADYLIITHRSLWSEAEAYKYYRRSNGYPTIYYPVVIDVDELYDQFAYGIHKNPLSIRNFLRFAIDHFASVPKQLFLIGKSYKAAGDDGKNSYRKDSDYYNGTLVPTFGSPPSDILFTSGIDDPLYKPAIPTGRLSAKTPYHVQLYLNKVIQYEQAQQNPQEWMKNILHFGGGSDASQQAEFRSYLNQYSALIRDTLFGGNVTTFLKTSPDPIQMNQSEQLKTIINNGVSMMTFFGHAAGVGFDVSIDHPSEYSNYGKYPFLLANSCWAGDIFGIGEGSSGASSSEEFVLIENKGVIGYLASISEEYVQYSHRYSYEFYRNCAYKNYSQPVGKGIQRTIQAIQSTDPYMKQVCLEMTLHGDPAIVINSTSKPDFLIDQTKIFYTPTDITSEIDSFEINIVPTNIGRAIVDDFIIDVRRTLADGTITSKLIRVAAPLFSDTIIVKFPVDILKGIGKNLFTITLDAYNEIDELSKINNITEVSLFIRSAEITPVYPYKYAIIPSSNSITLKASTNDPFTSERNYIFEIDTTDLFNSPLKQRASLRHKGGVVSWSPVMSFSLSTTYYWRVSPDSSSYGQYNWRESSFQCITGNNGWRQSHFYQFKDDNYQYVNFNRPARKFDFINVYKSLKVKTGYYPNVPWNEFWYKINLSTMRTWTCLTQFGSNIVGLNFAVFDTINFNPWYSVNQGNGFGQYNNVHCENHTSATFDFYTTGAMGQSASWWYSQIENFIHAIPHGYYVLAYSLQNHNAKNFPNDLYEDFESMGSTHIRTISDTTSYIFFGRKGSVMGSAKEILGTSKRDIIYLTDSVRTKWSSGYIESEIIGPAKKWESISWHQHALESPSYDSVRLNIIGVDTSGASVHLIGPLPIDSTTIINLDQRINATNYPSLKLQFSVKDDTSHTPAQLNNWQVIYDGAPETALDPSFYSNHKDTITEGDIYRFATTIHNISQYNMDSLLVSYRVLQGNVAVWSLNKRLRSHPAGDILIDSISFNSSGMDGWYTLWIEVNPMNAKGHFDQLEQYHFNNFGQVDFYVYRDQSNPLLDVTFDGVHILDGDIVSAKPEIQISLKDENKFRLMNTIEDTALFNVYIQYPHQQELIKVPFMSAGIEIMKFIPANYPNNKCRIEYKGEFLNDGTHKLIVQAKDKSDNLSGNEDYKISFEVINKATITEVMNWPNPFSTSTRFVFTLTGSEIPDYFMIQIMTITGKIVREIHQDELGPLHIGRNITQYAWDGKDEFGDPLANGIYLYRVLTDLHGDQIEKRETSADQYFTKGFGKMCLIH